MRIGVDVRSLAQGKNTGVEEYTKKMLNSLFLVDKENEYILFFNAWKGRDLDFSWIDKFENVSVRKYAIPNKILNLSLWLLQYPKLDKLCGGVDGFFLPNSNFIALSAHVKLFLTVHDLSFEHYKNAFSFKRRLWHFFVNPRFLIKRAQHIFAVSYFTKMDICKTYGVDAKKITVAHNGLTSVRGTLDRNSLELITLKEKYNLPYNFVLYFGTIEPRKNIASVVHAFDVIKSDDEMTDFKLVIAGATGWKADEIYYSIARSVYKDDIIILFDIEEKEKEALYSLASVFVYPSFFEGFGFPPLEAMACSVPIITSQTTSLPEVVGNRAILIDPLRQDELASALRETLIDVKEKKIDLRCKERVAYARSFTWRQVAEKIKCTF
ncbi:MAG: hypothetical protein CR972_01200 [Candidatus Moraniibacteriota bacterium]|nr:MAG: hypothetical protein CR972_01200 [Candidatus Moranbacteria bacterium]